jgi:hypothetical protein
MTRLTPATFNLNGPLNCYTAFLLTAIKIGNQ